MNIDKEFIKKVKKLNREHQYYSKYKGDVVVTIWASKLQKFIENLSTSQSEGTELSSSGSLQAQQRIKGRKVLSAKIVTPSEYLRECVEPFTSPKPLLL